MFLVDVNIVSALRKPRPHGAVLAWIQSTADSDLFLSALTIGEIQAGIEITREQDVDKALTIERWLNPVAASYNVLPMDADILRKWAKFMHRQSHTVIEDAMIAATALVHKLTVVTRNVSDFQRFDVKFFNPFDA